MQERGDMATGVVRALAFVGVLVVSLLFGMGLVMVLADAMSSDQPDVAPIELVTTTTVVDTVPPTTEVDPTLAPPTAGTASVPDPTPPPPPPPPPAPAPPPPPPPRPAPAPPPVAPDDDDDDFDDDDDDDDD